MAAVAVAVVVMGIAGAGVAGAAPVTSGWSIHVAARPTVFASPESGPAASENFYRVFVQNVSGHASEAGALIHIHLSLGGEVTAGQPVGFNLVNGESSAEEEGSLGTEALWQCTSVPGERKPGECTYAGSVAAYGTLYMTVHVTPTAGAVSDHATVLSSASVEGGGKGFSQVQSAPVSTAVGVAEPPFGLQESYMEVFNAEGSPDVQAGGTPMTLNSGFAVHTVETEEGEGQTPILVTPGHADIKQVAVSLPRGLIGDPQALPKCAASALLVGVGESRCPLASRIGSITIEGSKEAEVNSSEMTVGGSRELSYVYNMVPEAGYAAEFGFNYLGHAITLYASVVWTPAGYSLLVTSDVPRAFKIVGAYLTMFGNPAVTDGEATGGPVTQPQAFFRNPTTCRSGSLSQITEVESWQQPRVSKTVADGLVLEEPVFSQGLSGCESLQFNPEIEVQPESTQADTPTGYAVTLKVPQAPNVVGVPATPDVKDATVTLPAGVVLSPGAGEGLQGCTEAQFGPHSTLAAGCPEASQVGTAEVHTPLLEDPLQGQVFLAQPECDPCTAADAAGEQPGGRLLRVYVQLHGPGFYLKLIGNGSLNQETGQITTTFTESPQLPFSELTLRLKNGPRAALSNPQACGEAVTSTDISPWSAPESGPDATPSSSFDVTGCTSPQPLAPALTAGTVSPLAGAYSPFTITLTRHDREQDFSGLSVTTPPGLLGKLAGVEQCQEPQAREGTCSAASEIGTTTVAAGSGSAPLWLGGHVFLTGPYNGAPFGLSIVVPAVAGPFNLGTEVVRAAINVNPTTAALTITSSALPPSRDGIPFRLQTINVTVNRPGFTFNPTSCSPQQVTATVNGFQGATANVSTPFAAAGCKNLPFNPGFSASTAGQASKANGASLTVKVTSKGGPQPGGGEANIAAVKVDLPKQLPSRLTTLQKACTEAQFNTNPAGCPAASNVGTATAATPILAKPLEGPAYLVSHGGAAFPDLEIILQGENITLVLDGNTAIKNGITSSTFKTVPDAPISSFELKLPTGAFSVLGTNLPVKANYSLCGQTLSMPTAITAQNGAVIKQTTKIAVTGCAKVKKKSLTRAQKLAKALKACRKKKGAKRAACERQARKKYAPVKTKKKQ